MAGMSFLLCHKIINKHENQSHDKSKNNQNNNNNKNKTTPKMENNPNFNTACKYDSDQV